MRSKIEQKMCESVGLICKYLALEGLTWTYHCSVESNQYSKQYDEHLYGEGEFIIYYRYFDYPQSNHGRLTLCAEEDEDVFCIFGSYGVQGSGEHFSLDMTDNPSEELIKQYVERIATYLRGVRIERTE